MAEGKLKGLSCNTKGNYLRHIFKSHVIYFQEEGNDLKVIRILHGAMDVERHIRD